MKIKYVVPIFILVGCAQGNPSAESVREQTRKIDSVPQESQQQPVQAYSEERITKVQNGQVVKMRVVKDGIVLVDIDNESKNSKSESKKSDAKKAFEDLDRKIDREMGMAPKQ